MKTLYVSDLDGTLLRSDARTSEYTNQVINQLTSERILFSYATTRSYLTATKATKGLNAKIPCPNEKEEILNALLCRNIYPIVYAYRSGKEKYHCIFQTEIYSGEQWLEIVPKSVSKANAILQLKEDFGIEYIVAFGDGKNDIEMFEIADESYAVENAVDELKAIAAGIIESNDSDGVAKWLYNKFCATV